MFDTAGMYELYRTLILYYVYLFLGYTLLLVGPGLVVLRGENICEAAQKGNVAAVRHFLRTDLSTLHL